MRIALSFPGCHRRGGIERVMLESVNYLAARGYETHAFASDWEENAVHCSAHRHPVVSRSLLNAFAVPKFVRMCQKHLAMLPEKPDVIVGFGAAAAPGSVIWMTSVHAAWMEISRQWRRPLSRLKQLLNPFHSVILARERALLRGRQYRKVIALTAQESAHVQRFYGVPERDIEIIPNGYSPQEFNLSHSLAKREEIRHKLGIGSEERVVIFVANEIERKGLSPLLRAVASLEDANLSILAVGRLSAGTLASEIEQLQLRGRVRFTGPTNDVADYFAAADFFALPTYYEAWGLVIVEAIACGLPIVTSRLAGAAVAVREGLNGFLLDDPRDPGEITRRLRDLLNGKHASREMIAESAHPFAWDNILQRFERTLVSCR